MHYDIAFPNLGIYLDHVGKNIDIFGFTIAYYGIIIGCAILIGFLIAAAEAKRTRQNPEDYHEGQVLEAKLTSVDKKNGKLGVSVKALEIEEEKKALEEYSAANASGSSLGEALGEALKKNAS